MYQSTMILSVRRFWEFMNCMHATCQNVFKKAIKNMIQMMIWINFFFKTSLSYTISQKGVSECLEGFSIWIFWFHIPIQLFSARKPHSWTTTLSFVWNETESLLQKFMIQLFFGLKCLCGKFFFMFFLGILKIFVVSSHELPMVENVASILCSYYRETFLSQNFCRGSKG